MCNNMLGSWCANFLSVPCNAELQFPQWPESPHLGEGAELTVIYQQVNTTQVITIQSPGSAGHISTPPTYACNVSFIVVALQHVPTAL